MKYANILFILVVFLCQSCGAYKAINTQTDQEPDWVSWVSKYERGPCFGECPVYDFYLLGDHNGLIEVKYNLMEPGWYAADLDQEEVHEILMDIEPESWWHQDLSDLPEIADLPILSMLYKHKEGLRWMAVQAKMSEEMISVLQKLDHLVSEARWKQTKLRPIDPNLPEPTDVIMQLKEGVEIQDWMKKYESYGIRLKKKVSPKMQFYVVSKDPGLGSANDFLQYIKLDPEVIEAQWDQQLSQRR